MSYFNPNSVKKPHGYHGIPRRNLKKDEFWIKHDIQATKEMRLWYPRPPKEDCRPIPKPYVAKRARSLFCMGYDSDEIRKWFYLKPYGRLPNGKLRENLRNNTNTKDSNEKWEYIKKIYKNRCVYCGGVGVMQKDHLFPLNMGGKDEINNIVPACRKCNSQKRFKSPEKFVKKSIQLHIFK